MARFCTRCQGRSRWCHWCRVRHCTCSPHVSQARKYHYKVLVIKTAKGTRTMSARRFAHLKGAQKGGQTTATRPNPGRFDSDAARAASRKRWDRIRKVNKPTGLRLGMPRKKMRPAVNRQDLRCLYAREPRLGIVYKPEFGQWHEGFELRKVASGEIVPMYGRIISERTALRRLGHLNYARKNWVPSEHEPIVASTTGTDPAVREARRRKL